MEKPFILSWKATANLSFRWIKVWKTQVLSCGDLFNILKPFTCQLYFSNIAMKPMVQPTSPIQPKLALPVSIFLLLTFSSTKQTSLAYWCLAYLYFFLTISLNISWYHQLRFRIRLATQLTLVKIPGCAKNFLRLCSGRCHASEYT